MKDYFLQERIPFVSSLEAGRVATYHMILFLSNRVSKIKMVLVAEITGNELFKGLLVDMQGFCFLFLPNPHVK